MDRLDKAIEKTRAYGRKYGVEYGAKQIKERLISNIIFHDKDVEEKLIKISVISDQLSVVNKKIKKAKRLAKLIGKHFNDILMIGITGSVAAGYPKDGDDIDLMIVTKKDSLWLTRLLLRLFVLIKKIPHRGYGKKENGNEFCFNLWLEEDVLKLPKSRQNLKNAMDSILMIPILNRNSIYEKFLRENKWISKYLANAYEKIS